MAEKALLRATKFTSIPFKEYLNLTEIHLFVN